MTTAEGWLGAPFWQVWTASTLSNLADGVLKIALPLVAVRFTDSPALIGGLAFALTMPWLLFALPAGAISDRLDRRRVMVVANVVRAVLVAGLGVLLATGTGSLWALYVVAFAVGTTETLYDTSAQSILPQVVPRPALPRANARLFAAELTANQFVGPPLGGFLVAAGLAIALVAPGGVWLLAVVALALVPGTFRIERLEPTTIRADIAEGLRFLWQNRLLRTLAAMVGGVNFASSAAFAVFVLYAVGPGSAMQLSEPVYGVLLTTLALGSVVGALVAATVVRSLGRARSLIVAILASALLIGVPAVTTDVWVIGAAFALGSLGIAVWNVIAVSLRQHITPDRLLGRVNSCFRLVAWGTMPLGAAVGGLLGEALGLRAVFATMGVVALVTLVGMLVVTDDAMDRAEGEAES